MKIENDSIHIPAQDHYEIESFIDGGGVWEEDADIVFDEMRFSAGLSVLWVSPFGPIKFYLTKAFKKESYDKQEIFRFSFGTTY